MTEFIKVSTAAKRLSLSRQRVYKLIEAKKLHKVMIDGEIFLDGEEVRKRKDEMFVKYVDKLPETIDS